MNELQELLDAATGNDEQVRIHRAYNLGLEGGVEFQQGRCRNGCKFWNGLVAKPDYQELCKKYGMEP